MKIQLKRSNQLDGGNAKAPSIGYMEYGELAVNFNEADPCIFIKASDGAGNDSIVRIAGAGAESGGLPNGGTGERPGSPTVGDLFFDTDLNLIIYWDGTQWVPVSPGVITSDTVPTASLYSAGTLWYNNDEAEGALYILYEDPSGPDADAGGKIWVQIAGSGGGSGGSVVVADTPPNAANEGDLWFDSESGRLYIWYINANSQGQWIDASPDGGGDADGSDFVSKTDTNSQNIVSDLTLGTDKITLDATGGIGTFTGRVNVDAYIQTPLFLAGGSEYPSSNASIQLRKNTGSQAFYVDENIFQFGGSQPSSPNIQLNSTGTATFTNNVVFGGFDLTNENTSGARITASGNLMLQRDSAASNSARFIIVRGTSDETVNINSDGSAEFAAGNIRLLAGGGAVFGSNVNCGSASSINDGKGSILLSDGEVYAQVGSADAGSSILFRGKKGTSTVFSVNATGAGYFAGGTTLRNVTIELEPDNDDNYVSTTDVDEEGNTVETRVYNGPTLDVKERLSKADTALQTLKTAAAAAVDFAELKAAIATALADI